MKKFPVLTISLLCSGREETKKCLDSLNTLRKRVPSELIIVDTGCDLETRKLLYSYTDYIISYAWCEDFSAARNIGLENARGEWFMYIDDDEWFIETKAIENFFLSGEYRHYGSANYKVRNYANETGTEYTDIWVARLTSLKENVSFSGKIHEIFEPLYAPVKLLDSVAEHFHYVFETEEEKRNHSNRNIEMLKDELLRDSNNLRMWTHLSQEYFRLREYKKLEKLCEEALNRFEKCNDKKTNRHRGCFYCGLIESKVGQDDFWAAEREYCRAVTDKRNTEYCIARLMTLGAEIFMESGEIEKVRECCEKYFGLLSYYEMRPEELFSQETILVHLAFHPSYKCRMYSHQISIDLMRNNTESLKKNFDVFEWEKEKNNITEQFIPCLVKAMAGLPYEEIFVHVADVLANKPSMDIFWNEIEKIYDESGSKRLIRIFSEVTGNFGDKVGKKLQTMLQAEREDKWDRFSAEIKEAVSICPSLSSILKCRAEVYAKQRMDKNVRGKQIVSAEMQALAAQIKGQIPALLSQGMKKEALQVLEQLRSMIPEDEELEELIHVCRK